MVSLLLYDVNLKLSLSKDNMLNLLSWSNTKNSKIYILIFFFRKENMKSYDINRRLAIFYHPLFIEIITLFTNLLGGDKYGFIPFVEMNIRL